MREIHLCGISYAVQTPEADLAQALAAVGREVCVICTPNAEIAGRALRDARLRDAIATADLVLPDGDGVVLASRLAGNRIPVRRTGVELALLLLAAAEKSGLRVYLLGGTEENLRAASERVKQAYPNVVLCGIHNGYFNMNNSENNVVLEDIRRARPDITLVCMGAPRQEIWMAENRHRLPLGVYGGFGGVLDLLAGRTRRAPRLWQRLHLEWLYRVLCQPGRIRRLGVIPPYLFAAWRSRSMGRRGENGAK